MPGAAGGFEVQGESPEAHPFALEVGDCPGAKRLIGILDDGLSSCELAGLPVTWTGSRLFAAGSPGVAGLTGVLPVEFARFCAFDYIGTSSQAGASDYGDLFATIDGTPLMPRATVAADCRGEFEQADLYDPTVGAGLREAFTSNIDWDMGTQVDTDYGARAHVDVAVLDTVSEAVANDPLQCPANEHGLQMSALIREIDCPADRPECLSRVRNVMAMPRTDWSSDPDWNGGGHHGTQGDLAMGVFESVQSWRARREADLAGSAPRLILNLSLGWARLGDQAVDTTRGPAAALLLAMEHANCQGALLVAAAGNSTDELCPHLYPGALAPASFEEFPALTEAQCTGKGFAPAWTTSHPVFGAPTDYAPLVHAVGGLDEFDAPLINARPGGMPRLAALGGNGLASDGEEALAGSSVSAAVASGTAAVLWSYRPELTAPQVMQLIYDTGYGTGPLADFGLGDGVQPGVHRISVCAAIDAACSGQGSACPTPGCTATAPAADGYLASYMDALDQVLADPTTTIGEVLVAANHVAPVCPDVAPPLTNLTATQPDIPLCSHCVLTLKPGSTVGDDALVMTIAPNYAGQIAQLSLVVSSEDGLRYVHEFGAEVSASLNAQPEQVDVTRVLLEEPSAVSAALEFRLLDGQVQTNRIPVIQ